LVIELGHLRFIKAVPCNWRIVTMPPCGGDESETALAEPFEAPALAASLEYCTSTSAPVHLIGVVFFTPADGKLGQSQHGSLSHIVVCQLVTLTPLGPRRGAAMCLCRQAGSTGEFPSASKGASPDRSGRRGRAASSALGLFRGTCSGCRASTIRPLTTYSRPQDLRRMVQPRSVPGPKATFGLLGCRFSLASRWQNATL
jgi:hypothetical protein